MLKKIKNYTFNEGIKAKDFEKVKFCRNNEKQLSENKIQYTKTIYDDIELQIDLNVDEPGKVIIDGTNMLVVDSGLMIPYSPFYNSDNEFEYLNEVVDAYNGTMNDLVEAGICKEKVKK